MPYMNGIETILAIRQKDKKIPIIALSANVFEEDKKEAIKSGADDFLAKPVEEKEILLILEKYLYIELEYENKEKRIDVKKELESLPQEFVEKLKQKALLMDNDGIFELLKAYDLSNDLKMYIKSLVDEFKYQELVNLV